MKAREIAELIGGELHGDGELELTGVAGLDTAKEGEVSFLQEGKFIELASASNASCIITKKEFPIKGKTTIYVAHPAYAFIKAIDYFHPPKKHEPGISPAAIVEDDVSLGADCFVGAYALIGSGSRIGKNAQIHPLSYIGHNCIIGDDVTIRVSVTVMDDTVIGNRVIVHPGSVLGSDGYAYVTVDGQHRKIPQIGKVVIEDDCEIGANVTIDRASFGETRIKKGTKIDNLVQIAHNVTIGEHCFIVAQVGIAGSCTIGNRVTLAGQAGVADHLRIGDDAIVAAQGGVTKDIPPHTLYSGYPARDHNLARRIYAASVRLPELLKRVKQLEQAIEQLKKQGKKSG
jgi:UDP-3-O-[3-hydroxymyristoyl] glucosamine N-acyltransferase